MRVGVKKRLGKKGRKECERNGVERVTKSERHCGKREGWKVGVRGLPAIMSPQTAFTAGDRPALMNKVTNLSLIRQKEASKKEKDGKMGEEMDNWK